jgi:nucleoside-diphosphate-sugar epimerase
MSKFLIAGAGPVGSTTALVLAEAGHEVVVVTRRGTGPSHRRISLVTGDATVATTLSQHGAGATALLNCVNPPYTAWAAQWPPLAQALITAAEQTGAGLVTMSNLYGHGPAHQHMNADTPLDSTGRKGRVRAAMWNEAKAAHDAGRIRAAEVRASDFFGPEVIDANLGERVVPKVIKGKSVQVLGKTDVQHSFSYMPDVAATLAAVATATETWGMAWVVPSVVGTQRSIIEAFGRAAGHSTVTVSSLPPLLLRVGGIVSPLMKELQEVMYQFAAPFVVDAAVTTARLGVSATPMEDACRATVAWWQDRMRSQ